MSEVINYANNKLQCFCQIKLDSGERVLISIASLPSPTIKLLSLGRFGLWPKETIWEYSSEEAGDVDAYIRDIMSILDVDTEEVKHPLDLFRDRVLNSASIKEVRGWLESAEKRTLLLSDNKVYEEAWKEFEKGDIDEGLWARCFADSDGDENKAKAAYLIRRVKALKEEKFRKQEIADERQRQIALERVKKGYDSIIGSKLKEEPDLSKMGDVNLFGKWGETKLIEAARVGNYEEVVRLLAAGADPTLKERYTGDTARRIAEKHESMEIAQLLEVAELVYTEER